MSNKDNHKPFGNLQTLLQKIFDSKRDIWVDMEKVSEIVDDENAEELAKFIYSTECEGLKSSHLQDLVEIEKPDFMEVDGKWVVRQFLTPLGEKCLQSLTAGWIWSFKNEDIDVGETIKFYQEMINSGRVSEQYANMLISNKDERLKGLRSQLTLLRLGGEKENGIITRGPKK